jgi:EmrB/QacA subfamily drug resistance transporter
MSEPSSAAARASGAKPVAAPWGDTLSRRRIIFVIISILLGMLLSALDQTVVGTAMPRVVADLNGLAHYAWVATAYLLASAVSMPIWGKLSDAYGRKRFFMVGMAIFVIGSALCGQSHSMVELIAFRALQGLGAGAMLPIVQAILGDIFPPAQRAKWAGIIMSVFGFATIVGPLLGGWITDNIGWRWTFYVNLPVGILAFAFAAWALPGHVHLRKHVIDWLGTACLVTAAVPLLLAFSWAGSTYAWSSPVIIGLFVFSIAMWGVFYLSETRAEEPVLNPRLFQNRIFSVSTVASAIQSAAMFGAIMFLPLFVQGVLGKTATNSGTILMPMMLAAIVSSIGAGQLLARTGRYKAVVIAGFIAVSAGAFLLSRMSVSTSSGQLVSYMVVMGLGLGIAMSTFTVIVQNQYPTHRLGEVSAALQFFRSIGSTVGLAVFGTILNGRFAESLSANLPEQLKGLASNPAYAGQLNNPQVLLSADAKTGLLKLFGQFGNQSQNLLDSFMGAVRHSLDFAISEVFFLAMIISVVGLVVVFFLKEVPLRRTHTETIEEAGETALAEIGAEGGLLAPESFGVDMTEPEGDAGA